MYIIYISFFINIYAIWDLVLSLFPLGSAIFSRYINDINVDYPYHLQQRASFLIFRVNPSFLIFPALVVEQSKVDGLNRKHAE